MFLKDSKFIMVKNNSNIIKCDGNFITCIKNEDSH